MAQAIFAGGCFWCTEAVFRDVIGVSNVESGYIGGVTPNPTYKQVCSGNTGHAEAIRVTFDPDAISYGQLLDIFFATHDPTQLNRQGNDIGTQYRPPCSRWTRSSKPKPKPASPARRPIARSRSSPPSKGRRNGIRPRTTTRNTGKAKGSAIPIAWP
jgi:methionine-S-sulfoxide reductase